MKNFKQIIIGVFTSVLLLTGTGANAIPTEVDVKLNLVIDASGSISTAEFLAQMDGYVAAFNNATVIDRIENFENGVLVEMTFYANTAASAGFEALLKTEADSQAFAAVIQAAIDAGDPDPRPDDIGNRTNIAHAMQLAREWLTDESEYTALQGLVMDVSGDGFQNVELDGDGNLSEAAGIPLVTAERDAATDAGILVNGLAIDSTTAPFFTDGCVGPGGYYVQNVINNGVCVQSTGFASGDFEGAVIDKLVQDVAVPEPATLALFGIGLAGLSLRKRKLV